MHSYGAAGIVGILAGGMRANGVTDGEFISERLTASLDLLPFVAIAVFVAGLVVLAVIVRCAVTSARETPRSTSMRHTSPRWTSEPWPPAAGRQPCTCGADGAG